MQNTTSTFRKVFNITLKVFTFPFRMMHRYWKTTLNDRFFVPLKKGLVWIFSLSVFYIYFAIGIFCVLFTFEQAIRASDFFFSTNSLKLFSDYNVNAWIVLGFAIFISISTNCIFLGIFLRIADNQQKILENLSNNREPSKSLRVKNLESDKRTQDRRNHFRKGPHHKQQQNSKQIKTDHQEKDKKKTDLTAPDLKNNQSKK